MTVFTEAERAYLTERAPGRLARIATVGKDGTPHVAPVGWVFDAVHELFEVRGFELARSKKYRDIARTGRAALVVDDLVSVDPWQPRGVEVRGRAEAIDDPGGPVVRLHPERVVSWGLGEGRQARDVGAAP